MEKKMTQTEINERILELIAKMDQRTKDMLKSLDKLFSIGDEDDDNNQTKTK